MKKRLLCLVLCLGFIFLFGTSNKNYEVSNVVYTENSINLVGEQVSVKGIDEGTFHVLSTDGEEVRLLADFAVKNGYSYNSSSDGDVPVAFEDSMLYQGLMDGTKTWKSSIENNGGKINVFLVDAPTLEDVLSVGNFMKANNEDNSNGSIRKYNYTDLTPDWLMKCNSGGNYIGFLTKTLEGNGIYYVSGYYRNDFDKYSYIYLYKSPTDNRYGGDIRPVLETSIYNLSSENSEIQDYLNSVRADMDEKNSQPENSNMNENKAEFVKVPSTGADAPLIFTVVGIAIVVIAGIIIWVIVKDKKGKK